MSVYAKTFSSSSLRDRFSKSAFRPQDYLVLIEDLSDQFEEREANQSAKRETNLEERSGGSVFAVFLFDRFVRTCDLFF